MAALLLAAACYTERTRRTSPKFAGQAAAAMQSITRHFAVGQAEPKRPRGETRRYCPGSQHPSEERPSIGRRRAIAKKVRTRKMRRRGGGAGGGGGPIRCDFFRFAVASIGISARIIESGPAFGPVLP